MPPAEPAVTQPTRRRGWRIFFTTFKWCRIAALLFFLVAIILGLFLDHVGLPGWLERRVENQLRANGWEMKCSRLRLRWYRGIVAEDLQLQRTDAGKSPHLFIQRAEFRLNWEAFKKFDLEADAALLKGGRLIWPLPGTNQPPRTLVLDDLGGELLFQRGDLWELKFLEARLLGTHVRFRGDITNASLVRDWKWPVRPKPPGAVPGTFWHRCLNEAEKVRFAGRPELNVIFAGDARVWPSFGATLRFTGLGLEAPWGGGTNFSLAARLFPWPRTNDPVRAELKLTAEQWHGPWGGGTNLSLAAHLWPLPLSNDAVRAELNLTTEQLQSPRGGATNLNLTLAWEFSFDQLLATNVFGSLEFQAVQTDWGRLDRLFLELGSRPTGTNAGLNQTRLVATAEGFRSRLAEARQIQLSATGVHSGTRLLPATVDTVWTVQDARASWLTSRWAQAVAKLDLASLESKRVGQGGLPWLEQWRNIPVSATATLSNVLAPALKADQADLKVRWRFPNLELEAGTALRDGTARASASLQAETRELRIQARGAFDPQKLAPFFNANLEPWLSLCTFQSPPVFQGEGRLILPAWTNAPPDWRAQLQPTLAISCQLDAPAGTCRGIAFRSVHLPLALTNRWWTVSGFRMNRPEGALVVVGFSDQRTDNFRAVFRSGFDLGALRPAFPSRMAQNVFDFFKFTTPPEIEGEVSGNWRDLTRLNGVANVAATNAVFRGQPVKACTARVMYTNQFLSILDPLVLREGEQGTAAGIGINLAERRLFLTNAVGRLAPRAVTRSIGEEADEAVAPFVFDDPPLARAEGSVSFRAGDHSEDLQFEVEGGPFHWQRFHLEQVKARLFWRGKTLTITNLLGRWRGAQVAGWAYFDFAPKDTDRFSFHVRMERGDLRPILRDLQPGKTNRVEGTVSGELDVTSADTRNWKSWQGYGHVQLTNGLLWDLPLFGVFSPVLNTVMPGLGNSRARHATATYIMTNSVIYSKDLEIRATAMRMRYQGSVDFERHVEGRMEAELLRDLPALGFVISKVLWPVTKLFEYRITGTLDNPKTEELYVISRILLIPLHPFKTIREILGVEEKPLENPNPGSPDKGPE